MPRPKPRYLLTAEQLAKRTGLSVKTITNRCADGSIEGAENGWTMTPAEARKFEKKRRKYERQPKPEPTEVKR